MKPMEHIWAEPVDVFTTGHPDFLLVLALMYSLKPLHLDPRLIGIRTIIYPYRTGMSCWRTMTTATTMRGEWHG